MKLRSTNNLSTATIDMFNGATTLEMYVQYTALGHSNTMSQVVIDQIKLMGIDIQLRAVNIKLMHNVPLP